MKRRSIIISLLTVFVIFFTYKYVVYSNKLKSLENFYNGGLGVVSDINSFFNQEYSNTRNLPKRKEIEDYLSSLDSDFLKNPNQYSLQIDYSKKYVKLYTYGISKEDNNLRNTIDARMFINYDGNYKQYFTFLRYLLYGDYDVLLYENSF